MKQIFELKSGDTFVLDKLRIEIKDRNQFPSKLKFSDKEELQEFIKLLQDYSEGCERFVEHTEMRD